jgi:hypothetical protein
MLHNDQLLEWIEHAFDDHPICAVCGAPTTIADEDGRLWLVCSAALTRRGILARIGAAVLPHERRLVADLTEYRAA